MSFAASSPAAGAALRSAGRAAFRTLTVIALGGSLLTTAAYFTSRPVLFAQLSPFRLQYALLLGAWMLLCLLARRPRWAALFAAFACFNLWAIRPPAPPSLVSIDAHAPPLRILFANVLSSNRDTDRLLAVVREQKPDLIALLEINGRWERELRAALLAGYPHAFFTAREDNFGLALLSRQAVGEPRLVTFVDPELPSFACTLSLGSRRVDLLLTHPLPPGDGEGTRLRDRQLAQIIDHLRALPAGSAHVVLADFNATPWCPPLRRLLHASELRPAYADQKLLAPTWPANATPFLIPLDHALIDASLACTAYRVGPDIGSDHFPVLLDLHVATRP